MYSNKEIRNQKGNSISYFVLYGERFIR